MCVDRHLCLYLFSARHSPVNSVNASLLPTVSESAFRLLFYSRGLFALLLHCNDIRLQILQSTADMEITMTPWLHFKGGDYLLFKAVHPSNSGAIAGACIVLIILALLERWIAATRAALQVVWRRRYVTSNEASKTCTQLCAEH